MTRAASKGTAMNDKDEAPAGVDKRKYNGKPNKYVPGFKRNGLEILARVTDGKRRKVLLLCVCGDTFLTGIWEFLAGKTTSCGCLRYKHGGSETREYSTWEGMLARCRNKNSKGYRYYGARGISVCERWLKFENFLADMGPKPEGRTLDRINNDGNYERGNCRWATNHEQRINKRIKTHCKRGHPYAGDSVYVSPKGVRQCLVCFRRAKLIRAIAQSSKEV
jgi:hypothetical protein